MSVARMAYLRCHSGLLWRRSVILDGPVARMLLPRPLADGNFGQLPPVLVHQTVQMLHRQRQLQMCDDFRYFTGPCAFFPHWIVIPLQFRFTALCIRHLSYE